jgi:hypothetical protein
VPGPMALRLPLRPVGSALIGSSLICGRRARHRDQAHPGTQCRPYNQKPHAFA